MTRVLVLGLRYPPHHTGGYEVSCQGVVERLAQRGHELAVLTSTLRVPGTDDPPGERDGAVPVWRDLQAWFRDEDLYAPDLRTRWRHERANQVALAAALDRFRPDVVAAWQVGALSLGLFDAVRRRGIPVVFAVSDDWLSYSLELDAWSRAFRRWPRPLARLGAAALRVPTVVPDLAALGPFCFISEDTRRRAGTYAPWDLEDSAVVYSGIDGPLFADPAGARSTAWAGHLLYVGRFDPRKGIETAIRALADLPADHRLEVQGTGDPDEQARLERVAHELGLADRVAFARVARADLPARYRAADALVFPSEWEEPFGLTPVEAMACGTPVVATGVGGSAEFLLDGRNCLRFAPGDPADLARAVRRLAEDPALRARLVEAGRRSAEVLDISRLADAFEAWHAHAADRTRPRPASRRFVEELDGVA